VTLVPKVTVGGVTLTVVVVRAFVTDRLVEADLDVYVALPP
jgi:hypothetical protein